VNRLKKDQMSQRERGRETGVGERGREQSG